MSAYCVIKESVKVHGSLVFFSRNYFLSKQCKLHRRDAKVRGLKTGDTFSGSDSWIEGLAMCFKAVYLFYEAEIQAPLTVLIARLGQSRSRQPGTCQRGLSVLPGFIMSVLPTNYESVFKATERETKRLPYLQTITSALLASGKSMWQWLVQLRWRVIWSMQRNRLRCKGPVLPVMPQAR